MQGRPLVFCCGLLPQGDSSPSTFLSEPRRWLARSGTANKSQVARGKVGCAEDLGQPCLDQPREEGSEWGVSPWKNELRGSTLSSGKMGEPRSVAAHPNPKVAEPAPKATEQLALLAKPAVRASALADQLRLALTPLGGSFPYG